MGFKNTLNKILRNFNFEVHGVNYLQSLSKGEFKNSEIDIIKRLYGNRKLIIYDIGANRGLTIRNFQQNFPGSSIHAFEPYYPLYQMLKDEFRNCKSIFINQQGISDKSGELILNVNKSVDTNSLLSSKTTGLNSDSKVQTVDKVKVPITTIQEYISNQQHDRIHVCKIDIQGSELNALKGADLLLKEKKIDLIFLETYFIQQYEQQPLFIDIATYLFSFGYVLQDIYNPIYGNGKLAWCDSMFIRNDL